MTPAETNNMMERFLLGQTVQVLAAGHGEPVEVDGFGSRGFSLADPEGFGHAGGLAPEPDPRRFLDPERVCAVILPDERLADCDPETYHPRLDRERGGWTMPDPASMSLDLLRADCPRAVFLAFCAAWVQARQLPGRVREDGTLDLADATGARRQYALVGTRPSQRALSAAGTVSTADGWQTMDLEELAADTPGSRFLRGFLKLRALTLKLTGLGLPVA